MGDHDSYSDTVPIVPIVWNGAKRLNGLNVWNFKRRV
jgi:hypothetical protein